METNLEYRDLLKKYINHIIACEGIDFLSEDSSVEFTSEEMNELEIIVNG